MKFLKPIGFELRPGWIVAIVLALVVSHWLVWGEAYHQGRLRGHVEAAKDFLNDDPFWSHAVDQAARERRGQ